MFSKKQKHQEKEYDFPYHYLDLHLDALYGQM